MQLLSEKRYEDLDGINTLDVVIMCIPVEPAFITAVAKEPALYEEGFKKHIVLVGPSTLLLTLRIIAAIWRQEYQNRNALDIADRGQRLYEKFAGFVENLEAVGKAIDNAQKCYSDAHKQLCSGSGNLVGQAQKLHALGVKARKQLPKTLVEQSQTTLPDQTDPSHMKSFNKAADDLP
jgi:DNA recombination protein RmuC